MIIMGEGQVVGYRFWVFSIVEYTTFKLKSCRFIGLLFLTQLVDCRLTGKKNWRFVGLDLL